LIRLCSAGRLLESGKLYRQGGWRRNAVLEVRLIGPCGRSGGSLCVDTIGDWIKPSAHALE
jgi:hypothetical protein